MQVVINIPDELYEKVKHSQEDSIDAINIAYAVRKNGTALPKGHGRLIDVDKIDWWKGEDAEGNPVFLLDRTDISKEPTVLEADKEVIE